MVHNINRTSAKEEKDDPPILKADTDLLQQHTPAPKQIAMTLCSSTKTTRCVNFHAEGKYLLSSNEMGEVSIWKIKPCLRENLKI